MCEYCGCRDIPLIGRLSEEHYQAVDGLGALRRAIDTGEEETVARTLAGLSAELFPHNDSEEAGLFHELAKDEYFAPTVAELVEQHRLFRTLVDRIGRGDWAAYPELEDTLRHHIDREENGFFPATAVAVDGPTWEEIDRLTHEFNHARNREHGHTEAELLRLEQSPGAAVTAGTPPPVVTLVDPFTLRRMTPEDAAELVALWTQCGLHLNLPQLVAEELSSVVALHPELALVAVAGDSIVGSVLGTWDGRRAWITRLATRRDWRSRGVAAALMDAVEDGVRGLGGRKANLLIEADSYGVVDYYAARGYTTDDLIFMEKFL